MFLWLYGHFEDRSTNDAGSRWYKCDQWFHCASRVMKQGSIKWESIASQ